ncbi:MAG: hypothetical protein L3J04_05440 [Robiginitomaculum sp.]|nr:hypothetical protein [Robiginitomaculum sp.]
MSEVMRYKFSQGVFSCEIEGAPELIEEMLESLLEKCFLASTKSGVVENLKETAKNKEQTKIDIDETVTTNTIASATNAKTGVDLVIAAVARLQLAQGSAIVTRKEIGEEIKTATTFYKATYLGNLSAYLSSLTKSGRLNLMAKDTYSLSASEKNTLLAAISNI